MTIALFPRVARHRDAPIYLTPAQLSSTTTHSRRIRPSVSSRETDQPLPSRFSRPLKPTIPPAAASHSP